MAAVALSSEGDQAAHWAGDTLELWNTQDGTVLWTWRAESGMLRCTGAPTCVLRTDRMYENFVLELEWRHQPPQGNAGVSPSKHVIKRPPASVLGDGDATSAAMERRAALEEVDKASLGCGRRDRPCGAVRCQSAEPIDATTASWSVGRSQRIPARSREGWTRFVSSTTTRCCARSIHSEVPVKPRCPTVASRVMRAPAFERGPDGVSQPST